MYARLPMFSREGPVAYKKDLTNIRALATALGNPQDNFKSIHVAGTNGKGSVCHSLAAVLQSAGYKTGLYTSPHLLDFRERIRINGEMISREFVISFIEENKARIESIKPSFFEITVAMAFTAFAQAGVQFAVIETGLGGRLDSTNIITPLLTVITNVGLDHQNMLGDTIEQIAFEKAGIIKKHVPLVMGPMRREAAEVIRQRAAELAAPLYTSVEARIPPQLQFSLTGSYQSENVKTIITACNVLATSGVPLMDSIQPGLANVQQLTGLRGRCEILQSDPFRILIDVAHNEDGLRALNTTLSGLVYEKAHIVFGMVKDKDATKALALLPSEFTYYWCSADMPRSMPAVEIFEKAKSYSLDGETYGSVAAAFHAACAKANPNDLVVVCGSFFVVAEAMAAFEHTGR